MVGREHMAVDLGCEGGEGASCQLGTTWGEDVGPREDSRTVRGDGCCPQYLGGDAGSGDLLL